MSEKAPWWAQTMLGAVCLHAGAGAVLGYRNETRLDAIDKRLDGVAEALKETREDVKGLRQHVDGRFRDVHQDVSSLVAASEARDAERVRLLKEALTGRVKSLEDNITELRERVRELETKRK